MGLVRTSGWIGQGLLLILLLQTACNKPSEEESSGLGFSLLSPQKTGISFVNKLTESWIDNYFNYLYFYNGAGVAIGDINNDGLPDLYFAGNMVPNRLYLNRGNMSFEDISSTAGTIGDDRWVSGVTMADVNGDGYLDIYVSVSGKTGGVKRRNQLFINNRDLSFTEKAQEWGLDDGSASTQAYFFDYDRDGDLDLYLLNHPVDYKTSNQQLAAKSKNPEMADSDKLYRNDGDHFTDISEAAGIRNYGYGLSAMILDYNNDGWPDIYVANDFNTPDFLYLNQQDGAFANELEEAVKHTSNFSMGSDAADFNNDGLVDFMVLDMMPEHSRRKKESMPGMDQFNFQSTVENGFYYQYLKNTLQLNNGNGTFSEIGELAGIANTDWSWSCLFADWDNDGLKDVFITNGMSREVNNNDFNVYFMSKQQEKGIDPTQIFKELQQMPVEKVPNYFFLNQGNYQFGNKAQEWGLDFYGFSNGAAYADLDQDGDLDLVLNNLDTLSFVYENKSAQHQAQSYIKIACKGKGKNTFGIGARVYVTADGKQQYQEMWTSRGFLSSVEPVLHFGLGNTSRVEEVKVVWPDGTVSVVLDPPSNKKILVDQDGAVKPEAVGQAVQEPPLFTEVSEQGLLDHKHQENPYDDFAQQRLLPHKMSHQGPFMSVADVDGDGLEDVYIGGAAGQSGTLYRQQKSGRFSPADQQPWFADREMEDIGSLFFDADGDGDMDLYVVSGGNEFPENSPYYQDRLYLNNGSGGFQKATGALPVMLNSGSCVVTADYDRDGDLDLFIGGRLSPGNYPMPGQSYLLENQGGRFRDVTSTVAPQLQAVGMVTDAVWSDYDQDGLPDLVVVGEWMPLSIFRNERDKFSDRTLKLGLTATTGWWNRVVAADLDNDSYPDYVVGNLGLNYKYKASAENPYHLFVADLDDNGRNELVMAYEEEGKLVPERGRHAFTAQAPGIKKNFPTFRAFAHASVKDLLGKEKYASALHYQAHTFATSILKNKGGTQLQTVALPAEAQFSAVNAILLKDINEDGIPDMLLAGNMWHTESETPRNDAGRGVVLLGTQAGEFKVEEYQRSGFFASGDARDLQYINTLNGAYVLVANNHDAVQIFRLSRQVVAQQQPTIW